MNEQQLAKLISPKLVSAFFHARFEYALIKANERIRKVLEIWSINILIFVYFCTAIEP